MQAVQYKHHYFAAADIAALLLTMQCIWAVVGSQLVLLPVNAEARFCNAVCAAPDNGAKVRCALNCL
jgi:hypothetical protein